MEKVLFADVFTKNFKKILHVPSVVIDDPIFRLHYKVTGLVLLFLSILVTGYQFIGDPIKCIQKDDIPENLLNTYCWIEGTFSLPKALTKKVGVEVVYPGVDKYQAGDTVIEHAYYQWVCFVLFLQAVMFCVPHVIWKSMEGGKMKNLIQEFHDPIVESKKDFIDEEEEKEKKEEIEKLKVELEKMKVMEAEKGEPSLKVEVTNLLLLLKKEEKDKKEAYYESLANYYLDTTSENSTSYALAYMACEFLNFVNVIGQILFLDRFLGGYFSGYGAHVVQYANTDQENRFDPMIRLFPRLTKCTFHRYGSSGDVQKHDALCLLPLNILNEKIFVIMWFWLVILAILGGCVLIYRVILMCSTELRFKLLHYVTSLTPPEEIEDFEHWSYGKWFQLYLLADNIDNVHFSRFIKEFHKRKPFYQNPIPREIGEQAEKQVLLALTA